TRAIDDRPRAGHRREPGALTTSAPSSTSSRRAPPAAGCGASARGSPGQAERADHLVLEAPPVRGPDLLRGARRADGERRVADVPERLFVHGRWPRRGDEQDEAIAPAEGVDDLRELLRPEQARGADTPLEQQV